MLDIANVHAALASPCAFCTDVCKVALYAHAIAITNAMTAAWCKYPCGVGNQRCVEHMIGATYGIYTVVTGTIYVLVLVSKDHMTDDNIIVDIPRQPEVVAASEGSQAVLHAKGMEGTIRHM